VFFFLQNKKDKILAKNLGFYACSGFLFGAHEIIPLFLLKKEKIKTKI